MATTKEDQRKKRKRGVIPTTVKEEEFTPPRCSAQSPGPHHFRDSGTNKPKGKSSKGDEDSDEWQTCKESWMEITPTLQQFKKKRVWMPFYYDGKCSQHLRECGFKKVYHKKRDFFQLAKDKRSGLYSEILTRGVA